jgi:hypothetical protein
MRYAASIGAVALLVAAMIGAPWFVVKLDDPIVPFIAGFRVDLHALSVCGPDGTCESMSLARLHGAYPVLAVIAFWIGAATIVLVAVQAVAGRRAIAYLGSAVAVASCVAVVLAAYAFAPSPSDFADGAVRVERTLAPAAMLVGNLVALVALRNGPRTRRARAITDRGRLPATPLTPHRMVAVEPPRKRPASET